MKSNQFNIPFNRPHMTQMELNCIRQAHSAGQLAGDGYFTRKCHAWIDCHIHSQKSLLTHSCTAALEMIALLSNMKPGDEVIMPSFTFVTTANAFVLRGIVPVFVDIRPDTLNIDEGLIENAITPKTRAIVVVHYAGVSCEMDVIKTIAKKYKLLVIEDAAQGFLAKYKDKYLGTLGDMGAISFHETKNIISGEGGALIINRVRYMERADIVREKGTNRSKFTKGEVDKYTWVDIGSSYLPGEIVAAFLYAQLENAFEITQKRLSIWQTYHNNFKDLEHSGIVKRPTVPTQCQSNGHIYYFLTDNAGVRSGLIEFLKKRGIKAIFHYIPLHSSPAGKKYTRYVGNMKNTNITAETLIRLPMFIDMTHKEQEYIIRSVYDFFQT